MNGALGRGVTAKDMALYIISKMTTGGATGYFVEYAGDAVKALSMEGRLTLCNLSIEMGARGGMIAPDEVTFEYIKGREFAPKGEEWDKAVEYWKTLKSGADAVFDKEVVFDAADIEPMVTYGTNPGMGVGIKGEIPSLVSVEEAGRASFEKSLEYMGFAPSEKMIGKRVDYVFVGFPVYEGDALLAALFGGVFGNAAAALGKAGQNGVKGLSALVPFGETPCNVVAHNGSAQDLGDVHLAADTLHLSVQILFHKVCAILAGELVFLSVLHTEALDLSLALLLDHSLEVVWIDIRDHVCTDMHELNLSEELVYCGAHGVDGNITGVDDLHCAFVFIS